MRVKFPIAILGLSLLITAHTSCQKDDEDPEYNPIEQINCEHRNHAETPLTSKLLDMSFVDHELGWAVADQEWILYKYENKKWNLHSNDPGNGSHFSSVFAVNKDVIYLATEYSTHIDPEQNQHIGCLIYKSIDGGDNWTIVYDSNDMNISIGRLHFVNENVGFAVNGRYDSPSGKDHFILMTKDGGEHWNKITVDPSEIMLGFSDIAFFDEKNGLAVGSDGHFGAIYKTADSGNTWNRVNIDMGQSITFDHLSDIEIVSDNVVYVSGGIAIFRSDDGGNTWQWRSDYGSNEMKHNALFTSFFSADEGYSFGIGETVDQWTSHMIYTKNGGKNWSRVYLTKETSPNIDITRFVVPLAAYFWFNEKDAHCFGNRQDLSGQTFNTYGYFGSLFFYKTYVDQ